MYPKYFGLREASFSITPDPQYLFLSEQHREALAHLLYGAGEGGGFVLLTGEVGTGKTTVCRAFLEQLPAEVDIALILNPAVSVIELLRAICDEFRIRVEAHERTSKQLVDRINAFLLKAHASGRRPVLMIDEAQNLRPKVLEQIRLLTNLETPKHKLLQIFLVGQPELRRILGTQGLRQLDQRITARFHLRPLNTRETGDYIRHRLAVGGVERPLFTGAAVRRIHALSGGIPRLINILCDRALLGACVSRSAQVNPRIVENAAREVQGETTLVPRTRGPGPLVLAAALVAALAVGWWVRGWLETGGDHRIAELAALWLPGVGPADLEPAAADTPPEPQVAEAQPIEQPTTQDVPTADQPAEPEAEGNLAQAQEVGPAERPPNMLPQPQIQPDVPPELPAEEAPEVQAQPATPILPAADATPISEATVDPLTLALPEPEAMGLLLARWGLTLPDLGTDTCTRLPAYGLRCERDRGTWRQLYALDRPVLLRLRVASGTGLGAGEGYLLLSGMDDDQVTLNGPEIRYRMPKASLKNLLTGDYILVWQPPPVGGVAIIGAGNSGEAVRWLRTLLSKVPELGMKDTESGYFDAALGAAVRRFQVKYGLNPDGIAGPKTLIQLNNAAGMPGIPRLSEGS